VANIRDLRQRIRSVGNIQKITRAMEMVATTKLRRFQARAVAAKPYTSRLTEVVQFLASGLKGDADAAGSSAPLFRPGAAGAPHAILLVSSNRGLCGAYNANVHRQLEEELERVGGKAVLYVVGRKGMAYATRGNLTVAAYFEQVNVEQMSFGTAAAITRVLIDDFRAGKISGVTLLATRFESMMRYVAEPSQFLPIPPLAPPTAPGAPSMRANTPLLEPSATDLVSRLVPRYLETRIYHALLESVTSEYASRRFAMKNATTAAGDMKKALTRAYNRARQARITTEILEIVSGAEAL